jgi:hypothetical protein
VGVGVAVGVGVGVGLITGHIKLDPTYTPVTLELPSLRFCRF